MDGSLWKSIADRVQPHLPSIDPLSSSSEDEGNIEIFRRPTGLSLQLLDDEDVTSPGNNTELLEVIKPELTKEIKKQNPDTAVATDVRNSNCSHNKGIVLSFARLEHLDLDIFLNKQVEVNKLQHDTIEAAAGYYAGKYNYGDKEDYHKIIMEKIASLCEKTIKSPQAPNYVKTDYTEHEPEKNILEERKERPTVFIDLRCPSQTTKPVNTEAMPANCPSHVNMETETNYWRETGKSMLLREIRENNQRTNHINTNAINRKNKVESGKTTTKHKYEPDNTHNLCVEIEGTKPETESQKNNQELSKKQRDHHLKQYQQALKELEKCQPTKSVGQKQPAAENTDLLYDIVDSKEPKAIEANANVPFWVVGLQQLCTENELALYVLVVAKQTYTPRKKDSDIHMPFYNHVNRFLSETSLTTVAHWFPQLENMDNKHNTRSCLPSCYLSSFISATPNKKVIGRIFYLSPEFYWQTLEISITLGNKEFCQDPLVTHYTLQAIYESGLDICGLRLFYPSSKSLPDHFGCKSFLQKDCVLAIAVRGPFAHSLLEDINRTFQHMVRQKTVVEVDEEDSVLLYTPQQPHQVHKELCLCFSGRLESGNKIQVVQERASFLCATTKADIVLAVSPLIPPSCYGQVLSTCAERGFIIRGLQTMEIANDKASLLGFTSQQAQIFCTSSSSHKCLLLLLKKENALYHSISLPAALMKEFKAHNLLTFLRSMGDVETEEPCLCFHTAPYSNNMYHIFAQSAWAVPDPFTVVLSSQKCVLNLVPDEVAILTLCGQDMSQGLGLLHRALTQHGFELLGLKWLPGLSRLQALEVSPYEVGERFSHSALVTLMSAPALVFVLKRSNALSVLRTLLQIPDSRVNLSILMSPTPQVAGRQCALCFFKHELISCAVEK
ncbi:hypothetical protein WMY93_003840 [Mugilogobius chulae]|uniref:Uncharacterized protein n=1 Tax=Mugilogobius chulae TaxID=88201 RepID=A0AAW0Q8L9_9GOBI